MHTTNLLTVFFFLVHIFQTRCDNDLIDGYYAGNLRSHAFAIAMYMQQLDEVYSRILERSNSNKLALTELSDAEKSKPVCEDRARSKQCTTH